jgi:O-antigen ligase
VGERRGGVLAALAPVAMLVVDPAGWFPFGPVKWLAVSTLLPMGGALILARAPVRWPPRPLGLAMAALLGWLAVAALVGLDPLYAWVGTPERHLGVLTWGLLCVSLVLGASLDVERDGKVLAAGLGAACLGVGATAAAEAVGWEPDVFDAGRRLTATFGSSAYLGAATALLVPIALGLAFDHRLARSLRRAGAVATPLLLVASAGAGARAAWVGLVAAALVTAIGRRDHLGTALRAHPRLALVGTVTTIVGLIGVLALTPVGGRLTSITDQDEPGGRGRLDEWRVAVAVIAEHPVTGVGPEGYRIAFSDGVDARYERTHGRLQQPDRAHSGPLDVALAGGIPALLAWIVVLGLVGRSVLAVIRRGSGWIVGVGAGLVAHLVGQLLLFPIAELEPLAWLLAGVVLAHWSPSPRIDHGSRAASVGLGALALVALVAGVTDVVADRRAGDAIAALERGDHRAAAASAEGAVDLRPDIVRLHVLAATAIVADEQGLLAGIAELDAALDVSPGDPIVLRDRARLLVDRAEATLVPDHASAAEDEVRGLLAVDPNNAALWRLAARVAALRGDAPSAQEASERADDLTPPEEQRR